MWNSIFKGFNFCIISLLFIIALIFLNSKKTYSQAFNDEIGTTSSNDFYISKKDRYFTNGNSFHYRHCLTKNDTITVFEKKIFELESGQRIYNPFFAKAPDPTTHDRPFAAYLYVGGAFNWFYKNEKILKVTAQIGTIGPNALGQDVQTAYHKLLNVFKPQGWDYQVKNELGLNLSAEYNRLFYRTKSKSLDVTALTSALLGNTFSGANIGVLLRLGKVNPLYQSVSFNSLVGNKASKINQRTKNEFFVFLKPQLNFVAYDATISGGLFNVDKGPVTFDTNPLVFVQDVGASFSSPRWSTNFVVTLKSKEVKSNATGYSYATWSVFYRFNQRIFKW